MRQALAQDLVLCAMMAGVPATAEAQAGSGSLDIVNDIKFDSNIQVLSEFDHQSIRRDSDFNPENRIAKLVGTQYLLELRPNFFAEYDNLSVALGPRLTVGKIIDSNFTPPDQGVIHDYYINTWRVKVRPTPELGVSYGKEVLLWGNAIFRSPSNPFFADNGRINPVQELDGKEFAIVTYNPSLTYAATLLANVGKGRGPPTDSSTFFPITALKLDYVGETVNASVIPSKRAHEDLRLGGFVTWTASDAWLVYGEGVVTRGSLALYPEIGGPFGGVLLPQFESSGRVFYTALFGATYTFENGLSVTTEYVNNNAGYNNNEQKSLMALGREAVDAFRGRTENTVLAGQLLGEGLTTGLRLERRNYLFLQLLRTDYKGVADIAFRYAQNLDDRGAFFSSSITYFLNKRSQLYFVGSYNLGSANTEFSRLLRFTGQVGIRFFF
jgi:hypothetical protein